MKLWLIGTGPHSQEYAKVLLSCNYPFDVVGRGLESAHKFSKSTGIAVDKFDVDRSIISYGAPEQAIISVSYDQLFIVASTLISSGTKYILIEKPGALNAPDIKSLLLLAREHQVAVYIAYNRRFYAATNLARSLIQEDGGPTSCVFEFTEWSHTIDINKLPEITCESWMIANSSHVVDLAFHLCGSPSDWKSWQHGSLPWHSSAARFSGAGITNKGVLFSYLADWDAPGRWGIEVLTRKRRFVFRPMENLYVTHRGSINLDSVSLDDSLDLKFKPGLYLQTKAFLKDDPTFLCTLYEQSKMIDLYSDMAGYSRLV